ncbi:MULTISPECIES: ABC transporter ATP-binding protein [Vagococcus]|uniref:ABC transporter, ATP-binding protein n=1 Tax=Vagococcus fluvialis bH819 TaxID=1255619 RepID=A0A1X6WMK8_9ENTE|nr:MULTISPECIES: ABC transporter ATP-binding protein [Vagococcus]SLM85507.1 ABC transporter, ATP-binding protein [Vagococcus fluvialis bH819]HCM89474.1 ABC transporter ATP-binding protein [Vagococcus sp.]
MTSIIEIKGLTKTYKNFKAVSNICLDIKEGEIYGFIGPNGAGKSTTIKMLLNFIFPTSGEAKILGMDCVKQSIEIKKRVGYVSSDVRYYHEMTSLDIFKYTADFHGIKNSQEAIDYYVSYFEIEPNKKIADLSLGNKKKVAIVSALLQNPKLLILDEPTNGLDPMIQHRLFEVLEEKSKEGMTIFLSSHDLHEIQTHCDRAAFIKNGEIISIETINKGKDIEQKVSLTSRTLNELLLTEIGAVQIKNEGDSWQFIFNQDMNLLIQLLAKHNVKDLEIRALDLEDKFLSMYE